MIRDFEPPHPTEPLDKDHLQLTSAFMAGLIAGIVLLIAPRGSPWSSLTFFDPVILGRSIPALSLPIAILMHLVLALLYSLIISFLVARVRGMRAVIAGGFIGLFLYVINLAVVSIWCPELRGNEFAVALTHIVLGAIVGGAYRGLLPRRVDV